MSPLHTATSLRPQLIATDLDGTFLSPDGTVSDQNRAAVLAAHDLGIPVIFATGRPVRWLDVIKQLPGGHPTVIASNGAVLYDLGAAKVLKKFCISPETALDAVRDIRSSVADVTFAFESGTRFGYEDDGTWPDDCNSDPALFSGPAETLAYTEDFVKMLVKSFSVRADALLSTVNAVIGESLTATHSQIRDFGLVEVSAYGVSKAAMLQRCCNEWGIEAGRVAAFGDMPNDVDMLNWCGSPYVVANRHPALRTLGFTAVPDNQSSGVGRTIMELLSREAG